MRTSNLPLFKHHHIYFHKYSFSGCSVVKKNSHTHTQIVETLETIGKLHINDKILRSATLHTNSRITFQSLQNTNNHNYLIEEIRKSAVALKKRNWTIIFTWIEAYVGIYGNELADKLAKEAARIDDISFNSTTTEGPEHRQVAKPMGFHNKRTNNEIIIPNH